MKGLNKLNKKINISEPFSNLFTQGMVCHETYKDKNGNWLYPEEIEKINPKKIVKKLDKTEVLVGASESMSKSKKNIIDPEVMINQFGADAVRWFILSDSPPEKDVQWSDTGVVAANKFLQKVWDLNYQILNRNDVKSNNAESEKFNVKIKIFVNRIDIAVKNFRFNVAIANFYEIHRYLKSNLNGKINNADFKTGMIEIMKLMLPFTPHLANECLENLKCVNKDEWPKIEKDRLEEINLAVQVNGKTRDVITVKRDLSEESLKKMIIINSKAKKYIIEKKVNKIIFVKNKIINYIVS